MTNFPGVILRASFPVRRGCSSYCLKARSRLWVTGACGGVKRARTGRLAARFRTIQIYPKDSPGHFGGGSQTEA